MATDLGFTTDIKIGSSLDTVEDVKIKPHVEYIPGVDTQQSVDASDRYVGSPRCRWTYPDRELTGEQYYQLKNLVGQNASATVYIDIPTQTLDTTTYQPVITTYQAIMNWPEEGVTRIMYNRWQIPDDGIIFTQLVAI